MQASHMDDARENSTCGRGSRGNRVARVAVVGTGFVGATTAYALLISGSVAETVLTDRDKARAQGHVNDLRDAALFSHHTRVFAGDYADCCDADVIIITAGVSQAASMKSRLDNLKESAPPFSRASCKSLLATIRAAFCC
jgi:L-lactate dehydrogenase